MNAHDVMTAKVVVVSPDTPTNKISGLLLENGISAVPVVDGTGAPIGIVNEGDLIGCEEAARDDWWLTLLADGAELNADNLANLRAPERTAREIMAASVVTVTEKTDISEIARLLAAYRIKRSFSHKETKPFHSQQMALRGTKSRGVGGECRAGQGQLKGTSWRRERPGGSVRRGRRRPIPPVRDFAGEVEERFLDAAGNVFLWQRLS
jgi:hypothetical protein